MLSTVPSSSPELEAADRITVKISDRQDFDYFAKMALWFMLALTGHAILLALIIGTYKHFATRNAELVMEVGVQQAFANLQQGTEKEVQALEAEEEEIEEPQDVENPAEEEDPLPEVEEPVEEFMAGITGPGVGNTTEEREVPKKYASRFGDARESALGKYGGDEATEAALAAALAWLARHQSEDGGWNIDGYHLRCSDATCLDKKQNGFYTPIYDSAATGLCLLAFLGAGYDDVSGKYKETVTDAIRYLMRNQYTDGCYILYPRHSIMFPLYDHTIALYAMAEAYNIHPDPMLRESVERGLKFLLQTQQPGNGWDYEVAATGRNDVSISGWAIMALESCRIGGFEFDRTMYSGLLRMLKSMTHSNGLVKYTNKEPGLGRKGRGMAAVGTYSRLLLGDTLRSKSLRLGIQQLMTDVPDWARLITDDQEEHTMYYWYYGTLALFNVGGKDWTEWNSAMKRTLLAHQRQKGTCSAGSWDPAGKWLGTFGGRVYSTVMGALCMEVYYRYLPLYQQEFNTGSFTANEDQAGGEAEWIIMLSDPETPTRTRKKALSDLAEFLNAGSVPSDPMYLSDELRDTIISSVDYERGNTMYLFSVYRLLEKHVADGRGLIDFYRKELGLSKTDTLFSILNALTNLNGTDAIGDIILKMGELDGDDSAVRKLHSALVALTGEVDVPPNYESWDAWQRLRGRGR